jgi:hypothetical protein
MVRKLFKDMHTGKDGRASQRSVLGSLGFIGHIFISTYGAIVMPELIPSILWTNASLVAGLLVIKMVQSTQEYKIDKANGE